MKAFLEQKKLERDRIFGKKNRLVFKNSAASTDDSGGISALPTQILERKERGNGSKESAV